MAVIKKELPASVVHGMLQAIKPFSHVFISGIGFCSLDKVKSLYGLKFAPYFRIT